MAPHSSILAWRIPWTEEPGGLKSVGRKESDSTERLHFHFHIMLLCISFFLFLPQIKQIIFLISYTTDSNINFFFLTQISGHLKGQLDPRKKDNKQLN